MLEPQRQQLIHTYRDGLLHDTLPFWIDHCIDREHGGFLFSLDRDGSILGTDKPLWIHSRFVWLLSTLYVTVEPRPEWLELARHGIDFIQRHGFDEDGRMFFLVTRDGRPLRKRRYLFTEMFADKSGEFNGCHIRDSNHSGFPFLLGRRRTMMRRSLSSGV